MIEVGAVVLLLKGAALVVVERKSRSHTLYCSLQLGDMIRNPILDWQQLSASLINWLKQLLQPLLLISLVHCTNP